MRVSMAVIVAISLFDVSNVHRFIRQPSNVFSSSAAQPLVPHCVEKALLLLPYTPAADHAAGFVK